MKQAILYIAAFLGNKVNYSYSYPEHIKNRFYNNQLSQLKMVMLLLSLLALYYSYLGYTKSGWFCYFSFLSSFTFFLLTIIFLGLYFHRTDPNLNFPLKKYSFEKIKNKHILISPTPSNFITKLNPIIKVLEIKYTKSSKPKTTEKNIYIHKQFNKLTSDLIKFPDFYREKKTI